MYIMARVLRGIYFLLKYGIKDMAVIFYMVLSNMALI